MINLKLIIIAMVFAVIITAASFITADQADAQTTTPSETEQAVISCGDSQSGHGGSVDNPPNCDDEEEIITDAVVSAMQDAVADDSTEVATTEDSTNNTTVDSNTGTCEARTYTRDRWVIDTIAGEEVYRFNVPETIVLSDCPVSVEGSVQINYGSWVRSQ